MTGDFKKFKDLNPGDKIYGFVKEEIIEYTVNGKSEVRECRFGYYSDDYFKRDFVVKTDKGELSFFKYDENRSINFGNVYENGYGYRLYILATSLEEIEQSLRDLYEKEIKDKKESLKNANMRIRRRSKQLHNFLETLEKFNK